MPLDPSVILGYQPVEMPDMQNILLKKMQLQQMQQQGEVSRMQMDQHRNELMRQAGIDQFFKGLAPGATPDQITGGLRGAGYGKEALLHEDKYAGIAKERAQTANLTAEAQAKNTQAMSSMAQALSTKPGGVLDTDIARFHDIAVRAGWTTPEDFAHDFRDLPQSPADRAAYMGMSAKSGVAAAEQLKQQTTQQQMAMTDRHQRATEGLTARGQGVTIRGQDLTNARAHDTNATTAGMGKVPAGYRSTPEGNLQAIPGGPADLKLQGSFNQDTAALTSSSASMDRLANAANEAMNHPGLASTAGWRGSIPNIPGSKAADAAALLNTLKSQVAFGVLQDMRNNSKTGGALGNVSDAEGKRLEANLAALEKSQSPEQLKANLQKIVDYTSGAKDRLRGAYNMKHSGQPQGGDAAPAGGKQIKRTGTVNGLRVVEYSDGSLSYQ